MEKATRRRYRSAFTCCASLLTSARANTPLHERRRLRAITVVFIYIRVRVRIWIWPVYGGSAIRVVRPEREERRRWARRASVLW